jgi:DNA-binding beta-propeller fold protein YncE
MGLALTLTLSGVLVAGPSAASSMAGATQEAVWLSRYYGPVNGADAANSMAMSPDGTTVFVTGGSEGSGVYQYSDYATVAYDAATGVRKWAKRYNGTAGTDDSANSLAVSDDGTRVFVTGGSGGWGSGRITPRWPTTPRRGSCGGPCATTTRPMASMRPMLLP